MGIGRVLLLGGDAAHLRGSAAPIALISSQQSGWPPKSIAVLATNKDRALCKHQNGHVCEQKTHQRDCKDDFSGPGPTTIHRNCSRKTHTSVDRRPETQTNKKCMPSPNKWTMRMYVCQVPANKQTSSHVPALHCIHV